MIVTRSAETNANVQILALRFSYSVLPLKLVLNICVHVLLRPCTLASVHLIFFVASNATSKYVLNTFS